MRLTYQLHIETFGEIVSKETISLTTSLRGEDSMNFKSRIGIVVGTAMMMAVGMSAGQFAAAAELRGPSGNLDLRLNGYEVVTPENSTTSTRLSIDGIGQVIARHQGQSQRRRELHRGRPNGSGTGSLRRDRQRSDHAACGRVWLGRRRIHDQPEPLRRPAPMPTASRRPPHAVQPLAAAQRQLVKDLDAGQYHCIVTGMTAGHGRNVGDQRRIDGRRTR